MSVVDNASFSVTPKTDVAAAHDFGLVKNARFRARFLILLRDMPLIQSPTSFRRIGMPPTSLGRPASAMSRPLSCGRSVTGSSAATPEPV